MSGDEPGAEITVSSLRAAGHLKWTVSGPGLLGACVAETDYGTAPPVSAALAAALQKNLLGYVSPGLVAGLSEACAGWQRDAYGWDVTPDDVRLLPDVVRAFHVAVEHFSRPGSPVIVPVPTFSPFLTVPGLLGRRTIEVELVRSGDRYVYDLDALDRAFREGGHLLVLSNPHNPLGRVLDTGELTAISEVVDRHGGRVFSDEVHAPLVYVGHHHVPYASTSPTAAGHTLTAVSASKAWNLAGLKCAQMVLTNDVDRARWEGLGRLATDGASILGVVAGTAAYRDGGPWLDGIRARLDLNRHVLRKLFAQHLPGIGYLPPEGTYLAWLDCRGLGLARSTGLADFFLSEAGVTTVDGASCGASGQGFVRLNFATSEPILDRIVRQLADAVHRHAPEVPTSMSRDSAVQSM